MSDSDDLPRIDAIQTRWSLVTSAHATTEQRSAEDARRLLVMRYIPAIRRYVGAILNDPEQADDLTQDFAMRMMKGDFAGANPHRGRFRDLLKTAVRNMVKNHWEKSNRRRPVDHDLERLHDDQDQQQDAQWTAAWRKSVIDQTWARMLADEEGKPSPGYQMLKLRTQFPDDSSEALAHKLSEMLKTPIKPDTGRQMLRRARQRFVAHLLDEIRAGIADESDDRVQEELADLGLLEWMRES
jgi:RNA polymerase sigma-70 factor (ECF subfamily)